MSNNHTGNIQPQLDLEEHTTINGIAGKKVYVIDSAGNLVDFSDDSDYTVLLDKVSDTVTYIGYAVTGSSTVAGKAEAIWKIKKFDTTTASDQKIPVWADGNTNFDNIWDNRASLSYS
jgi:hypothetical protein